MSDALICFSHLRWDFVFQRPQHLMTRFAGRRRVVVFEEPMKADPDCGPSLDVRHDEKTGVTVATPKLPEGLAGFGRDVILRQLLDELVADQKIANPTLWYYTPMMVPFSRHVKAAAVVYDCMDELANFRFAPPELKALEAELMSRADVVFTGGYSLYEAKQHQHPNVHPFPSSVDRAHFAEARAQAQDPAEVADAPRPRLGYYGVIDERLDLELIAKLADARPDWTVVMVGPVVKISPEDLPKRKNILWLGGKAYSELPAHLGSWDAALMPFALNDSTRFISPTKTPEYLAGGRPVVSTPVADVVRSWGDMEAVKIAGDPASFVAACEAALELAAKPDKGWLEAVDERLADLSWDQTLLRMAAHVDRAIAAKASVGAMSAPAVRPSRRARPYDYLIVGAGFAGSVIAERLAAGSNRKVLLIDRRPHIAGNAFDHHDAAGVLIHQYGPHIFHTNSAEIFDYLSRFTTWRPYEHRVLADVDGKLVPMPINRTTLNALYGLDLKSDEQAEAFLKARAEPIEVVKTSRDVVVSQVGRELYETFFQGYTRKQWGMDPSELDRSVAARVPARANTDDRYFLDSFQAMPANGYTRMFENMLDHTNIDLELGVDFDDVRGEGSFEQLIFTGPVDEYFDHRYGPLPYRSLKFRHETVDKEWFQPVAVVNYPSEATPYTRITEYKHLTGQTHRQTSITYEYPCGEGAPYYPVPRPENQALYKRYEALAMKTQEVTFVGRLATYRYYNMDQVTGQALATWRRITGLQERKAAVGDTGRTAAAL